MKHLWSLILSALTAFRLLVLVGCTDQPDWVADSTSEALTSARAFLTSGAVGFPVEGHPQVASLLIVDLDQDGLLDILVCDVGASRIGWIRQSAAGEYRETWIGPEIKAPARVQPYDLDHDGDLDLLIVNTGQTADLLRNDGGNRNNSILVRLVGEQSNRDGIGARLRLEVDGKTLLRDVKAGSSYLAQNDLRVHFGLGQSESANRLEVVWPSGTIDEVENLGANQVVTVSEGSGATSRDPYPAR